MGGGAFLRLNAGDLCPESSKQAEIRLADMLTILWNRGGLALLAKESRTKKK